MNRVINLERILCPVAQSHERDEGLQYAIALARSYGASLFVVTCSESSPLGEEEVAEARKAINRAVEQSFVLLPGIAKSARLEWELVLTDGMPPADAIIREAGFRKADLIVNEFTTPPRRSQVSGLDRRDCISYSSVPGPCYSFRAKTEFSGRDPQPRP